MHLGSASWYNKDGNKGQLCYRHFCAKKPLLASIGNGFFVAKISINNRGLLYSI
nr:MAG TPA: hypothetical protein [Caudoviricetes sp.]